ncbi:MAG TPA: holo-ACP synthase [Armatimonadota bacterium]|nr:holo-ACP synthase [Armatimonadota bacterium]
MRLVGHGIDAVEMARVEGFLRSPTRNWATGIFSLAEREQADEPPLDVRYYAGRFAGKEAVSKALGTGMAGRVTVHTIEILRLPSGAPTVHLIGGAREAADGLGVTEWFISITYCGGLAIASAIAAGN